ncbi:MAG: C_GCAxxG_C_C family protein [Clostridia bacterium]|nr:C_GCAxxG_C_C family protein [Clostridia bacterium]
MTHEEKALQYFKDGANCAQAVVLAFHEELGIDEAAAARLGSSFGGGIGRLREVCGAVSGMMMVYGMLRGYDDLRDPAAKKAHYQNVQALAAKFREENGSIVCRELLDLRKNENSDPTPTPRDANFIHSRSCAGCVPCAARLLDEALKTE